MLLSASKHCAARRLHEQRRRYILNLLQINLLRMEKASLGDLLRPGSGPEIGPYPRGVHRPNDNTPLVSFHMHHYTAPALITSMPDLV